ncbi:MAG TPA: DUF2213 domain-containing protein, partial [Acidobacteriaceae bacterium]|nr:DUF2213 domain-containing protein [Acidobacteriaceae bacterium]
MPVHTVTMPNGGTGYQWGGHGAKYRSKAGAERQAAAAFAHGYKGDIDPARDAPAPVRGAGIMFVTPDNRALFLRRTKVNEDKVGEWDFPGGGTDGAETPEETAKRETLEEIGALPYGERTLVASYKRKDGFVFDTFRQPIAFSFTPKLSPEHDLFIWAPIGRPPEPLIKGLRKEWDRLVAGLPVLRERNGATEPEPRQAQDAMAFDRASVRSTDQDGRLHVELTPISKACVNEYIGSEIPGCEELGLDPKRIYKLLRDPEELARAAPTFNNIPLLNDHVPVTVDSPQHDLVCGATGSNTEFDEPYLKTSLVVWTADAIAGIDSGEQQEISCAYHYVPDMTPGTYKGERY